MTEKRLHLADAEATTTLGARIALLLRPGEAVLLYGDLGMGKSTLARGLIRALTSPDQDVPSPTFTLVQFYEGQNGGSVLPVAHFDLYRLTRPEEAFEIGLDEALDEGVALIEWPERLGREPGRWLGPDRLTITLSEDPQAADLREGGDLALRGRTATVSGAGAWDAKLRDLHD